MGKKKQLYSIKNTSPWGDDDFSDFLSHSFVSGDFLPASFAARKIELILGLTSKVPDWDLESRLCISWGVKIKSPSEPGT